MLVLLCCVRVIMKRLTSAYVKIYSYFCILSISSYVAGHLKNMGDASPNKINLFELYGLGFMVAGGKTVELIKYPFNVQFFNLGRMCSGSILSSKIVLTAAHCFDFNSNLAEMKIFSNSRFASDSQSFSHEIWDYVIHEQYNNTVAFSNDIAIIVIQDIFKYGPGVQKALLCDSDVWMRDNETLIVTGWGETEYGGGVLLQRLRMAELRYISNRKCHSMTGATLTPDMFCLYGDGVRDTCRGDSGGGVLWNNMIVGIVSHGQGCMSKPGVYTNVHYFKEWINRTAKKLYRRFCSFHENC